MEVLRGAAHTAGDYVHTAENYLWGGNEQGRNETGEEPVAGVQGQGTAADPYDAGNAPKVVAAHHAMQGTQAPPPQSQTFFAPGTGSSTTPAGGTIQAAAPAPAPTQHVTYDQNVPVKEPPQQTTVPATTSMQAPTQSPTRSRSQSQSQSHYRAPSGSSSSPVSPRTKVAPEPGPSPLPTSTAAAASANFVGGSGGAKYRGSVPAGGVSLPPGTMRRRRSSHGSRQYVRSTGYAAEGGDFDAERPGAGREADRLMAEHNQEVTHGKGHPKDTGTAHHQHQNAGSSGTSQHHPKVSKMKEKLHIGKHHT
ncbi:hypothetical protein AJ79_05003 [Helicocarpus griseus UAMH5409]|uniref:Uncharacterized protein n=1 Tax=Helicocarpus griseus UAMH5409 TaxID=1447875 RepID=A0A2B7XRP4_9EURO|nr:hypothetical protein AJ79_05003 [Helicocarpus griseus UAMH5409]